MRRLLVLALPVLLASCWDEPPGPKAEIDFMTVSASKDEAVSIRIEAMTMWGTNGPVAVSFDSAEVWLEEIGAPVKKHIATTAEKTYQLDELVPDRIYNVYVAGIKRGEKTEMSQPARFSTYRLNKGSDVVQNTDPDFKAAVNSPFLVYYKNRELIFAERKSGQEVKRKSLGSGYLLVGLRGNGNQVILQGVRNNERVFFSYDVISDKMEEKELPKNSRVWSYDFSIDGNKIAYKDYSRPGLFVYDFETRKEQSFSPGFFNDVFFGNNDSTLYLTRPKGSGESRELAVFDLSTAQFSNALVNHWVSYPQMSPDSRFLMFGSEMSGSNDTWIYETGTPRAWQISGARNICWIDENRFLVLEYRNDQYNLKEYTIL